MGKAIQFIGTQRSGSNLLRLILNQHPKISAPHPPHLLKTFIPIQEYYNTDNGFKLLQEDMYNWVKANPVPWTQMNYEDFNLDKPQNIYRLFESIYDQKRKADGADFWCCKSTFNVHYLDQIEGQLKPFYIHLYRDGRDVTVSFKKVIVGHKHVYNIAKQWDSEQKISMRFLEGIPEDRKFSVSYEDLLEDPEKVAGEICGKLNIEYDPQMLLYYTSQESQHTADSGKMWEHVVEPVIKNNKGKYLKELSQEEIMIFEKVASETLITLGYELEYANNQVPINAEAFTDLDKRLILERRENASPEDKKKRAAQDELLKEIHSRFSIPA